MLGKTGKKNFAGGSFLQPARCAFWSPHPVLSRGTGRGEEATQASPLRAGGAAGGVQLWGG